MKTNKYTTYILLWSEYRNSLSFSITTICVKGSVKVLQKPFKVVTIFFIYLPTKIYSASVTNKRKVSFCSPRRNLQLQTVSAATQTENWDRRETHIVGFDTRTTTTIRFRTQKHFVIFLHCFYQLRQTTEKHPLSLLCLLDRSTLQNIRFVNKHWKKYVSRPFVNPQRYISRVTEGINISEQDFIKVYIW